MAVLRVWWKAIQSYHMSTGFTSLSHHSTILNHSTESINMLPTMLTRRRESSLHKLPLLSRSLSPSFVSPLYPSPPSLPLSLNVVFPVGKTSVLGFLPSVTTASWKKQLDDGEQHQRRIWIMHDLSGAILVQPAKASCKWSQNLGPPLTRILSSVGRFALRQLVNAFGASGILQIRQVSWSDLFRNWSRLLGALCFSIGALMRFVCWWLCFHQAERFTAFVESGLLSGIFYTRQALGAISRSLTTYYLSTCTFWCSREFPLEIHPDMSWLWGMETIFPKRSTHI